MNWEGSVLFFNFILYQPIWGRGFFSSAVQEFRMKRSSFSIHSNFYIHIISCQQLHSPSLICQSLSYFLHYPESCPASLQMLLLYSFPDTLQSPKTLSPYCLWRGPMSSPSPSCTQSISCKDVKPRKCRHPQLPVLLHLPTLDNGSGCAEKAHGDQY